MAIVIQIKDGETYLGDADAQIAADDTLLVSVAQINELFGRRLDAARLAQLGQVQAVDGFATIAAYAARGFIMRFDKRTFELTVSVATADRAVQTIALADLDTQIIGEFAEPASFSAYLNIRGSLDYVHTGFDKGLTDPFFLFDGAMRIAPFVVEAEGGWDGIDRRFVRSGTRVVYDDAKRLLRWTAGDLQAQNRGFQGLLDVAGVGIVRSYALLEPQRNVAPRGGRTFSVARNATVEALVNGRPIRTLRLQPGTYNLSDFPFAQGGNDVELIITDDTGQREVISFSTFVERTQLAPGLSEFSLNVGVLTRRESNLSYTNDPAVTGFYRRGLNEFLTVGANFQYARESYLVGAEAVLGTSLGTIGADVAVSQIQNLGSGWAANFSLERITQSEQGSASLLAAIELRSRRFGAVEQLFPDNPYDYNVSVSYNRSLGRQSFIGIQGRYAHGRDAVVDERSARLTFGRRLGNFTNLTFDAEWSNGVRGDDKSFRISLVRRFGTRTSARAEFDGRDNRVRLGAQSSGGYGIGAWSVSGNADIGKEAIAVNAAGNYVSNRADIGVAHAATYSPDSRGIVDQRTSLRLGSSIAFAGGMFTVGRPINDSFAIVRPFKGSKDLRIEVEPAQGSAQARSGVLGPALFGQLTSYSARTLTYDAPEAPAGLDIGTGSLRTFAPYRSGYVVTVGSDYNVMAIGTLLESGQPLDLKAGFAQEVGGEKRKVELFTNREGRFAAAGLKPGRWRIEIAGPPPIVYDLVIPETAEGVVRIGELVPMDEGR